MKSPSQATAPAKNHGEAEKKTRLREYRDSHKAEQDSYRAEAENLLVYAEHVASLIQSLAESVPQVSSALFMLRLLTDSELQQVLSGHLRDEPPDASLRIDSASWKLGVAKLVGSFLALNPQGSAVSWKEEDAAALLRVYRPTYETQLDQCSWPETFKEVERLSHIVQKASLPPDVRELLAPLNAQLQETARVVALTKGKQPAKNSLLGDHASAVRWLKQIATQESSDHQLSAHDRNFVALAAIVLLNELNDASAPYVERSQLSDQALEAFGVPTGRGKPLVIPSPLAAATQELLARVTALADRLEVESSQGSTGAIQSGREKFAKQTLRELEPEAITVSLRSDVRAIATYFSLGEQIAQVQSELARQDSASGRSHGTSSAERAPGRACSDTLNPPPRAVLVESLKHLTSEQAALSEKIVALSRKDRLEASKELKKLGKDLGFQPLPADIEGYWQSIGSQAHKAALVQQVRSQSSSLEALAPYLKRHKRTQLNEERARGIEQKVAAEDVRAADIALERVCPNAELRRGILSSNPALFIESLERPADFQAFARCLDLVLPRVCAALDAGRTVTIDDISSIESIHRWLEAEQKVDALEKSRLETEAILSKHGLENPTFVLAVLCRGGLVRGSFGDVSEETFDTNARNVLPAGRKKDASAIRSALVKAGLLIRSKGGKISYPKRLEGELGKVLLWARDNSSFRGPG